MCGIVGAVAGPGRAPRLSDGELVRWRDTLLHRGPDGGGTWRGEQVALGHRRLAVRDLSAAAAQPMVAPGGRHALAYNGELYNDAELRADLASFVAQFGGFKTTSDAETVLVALLAWGSGAFTRLRGMYAIAWVDLDGREVLLARDPLGVKPLYWAWFGGEVLFASEPKALLAHPLATAQPDLGMISAYLTTARRELGERTLFEGVRAVRAGEVMRIDLDAPSPEPVSSAAWLPAPVAYDPGAPAAAARVAAAVEDSLRRQLVSDVPVCALLSGGLDSTILVQLAIEATGRPPTTWCAGGVEGDADLGPDGAAAREVAAELGTRHGFARVDRALFLREWPKLVAHLGTPLSTPNEVAISEVARVLAAAGNVVALSGEGADELFGGYDAVLDTYVDGAAQDPGELHLSATTWVPSILKPALFGADALALIEDDALLRETYGGGFARCRALAGPRGSDLDAHLRLQRELNLTALLQRLDAATMRHGVEGRTPFADSVVARVAEALPVRRKFARLAQRGSMDQAGGGGAGEGGVATAVRGKLVLRDAFRGRVPRIALERPKASFPLPFQEWCVDVARGLPESPFARALFLPGALGSVADNPREHWRLAWPLANLALWGDQLWS
ncbi:MAG: asparagine synthase (glutamine-hydrolyzing) [Planctomycetota bacterium]